MQYRKTMNLLPQFYLRGLLLLSVTLLAACDSGNPIGERGILRPLNASYEDALAQTETAAYIFPADSVSELQVLERLQDFFSDMTVESVRANATFVYAPEAYLNDNVVGISGVDRITDYFAHAALQADVLDIVFLDVARSKTDYYIRWQMRVDAKALSDGESVFTYGTTQFRFDREGRVIIHRDFWDAATGIYEHLPYLGPLIKYVHRKLGGDAALISGD